MPNVAAIPVLKQQTDRLICVLKKVENPNFVPFSGESSKLRVYLQLLQQSSAVAFVELVNLKKTLIILFFNCLKTIHFTLCM